MTKHFAITEWVDFSRGLVSGEEGIRMRQHLETGCGECRRWADFCDTVSQTAMGIISMHAPDEMVHLARAIFPVRSPSPARRKFRLPVELIYDSFLAPAPAGLRSSWQVGWQGLYQAGDCSLDLRIEPDLNSSRAAVIGQITNHVQPGQDMRNTQVCLKAGEQVIAEAVSNRFGEFQMEYEQQGRLQLCVYLDGGSKCIQIPLKKRATENPLGGSKFRWGARRKKIPGSEG